jgi:non-ribosomal peptide synthetase-like protein
MDMSLEILGPLYSTLYVIPWLRMLGAKIGRLAEVSTGSSVTPDLLKLDEGSFIADAATLGSARVENNTMTLGAIDVGRRAFIGNSAFLPGGTYIGEETLIGVLSTPPLSWPGASKPDTTWLGSPAIYLPQRQSSSPFDERHTFKPTRSLYITRLAIEYLRVTLPATVFIALSAVLIGTMSWLYDLVSVHTLVLLFPLLFAACGVVACVFVIAAKRVLMGRYKPQEKPLWSGFVWRNELIIALHEYLAEPFLLEMLSGTPMAAWFFRLMGTRIGRRPFIETNCFTEYDLIRIGDNVCLNLDCTLQTHLFEDRVMKMSTIEIGDNCTVGQMSIVLYDSKMESETMLGDLSLLMKGETLPQETRWEGSPARRRDDEGGI